jgi:hypothetical protein
LLTGAGAFGAGAGFAFGTDVPSREEEPLDADPLDEDRPEVDDEPPLEVARVLPFEDR